VCVCGRGRGLVCVCLLLPFARGQTRSAGWGNSCPALASHSPAHALSPYAMNHVLPVSGGRLSRSPARHFLRSARREPLARPAPCATSPRATHHAQPLVRGPASQSAIHVPSLSSRDCALPRSPVCQMKRPLQRSSGSAYSEPRTELCPLSCRPRAAGRGMLHFPCVCLRRRHGRRGFPRSSPAGGWRRTRPPGPHAPHVETATPKSSCHAAPTRQEEF
jgi:hypothetical protein